MERIVFSLSFVLLIWNGAIAQTENDLLTAFRPCTYNDLIDCYRTAKSYFETLSTADQAAFGKIRSNDCADDSWSYAQSAANDILRAQSILADLLQNKGGVAGFRLVLEIAIQALRAGAESHLQLADKALNSGCLDFADHEYRFVLAAFSSTAMAAYRERAQVGITDVNNRRNTFSCRWFGKC